jgi:hypothetical protein
VEQSERTGQKRAQREVRVKAADLNEAHLQETSRYGSGGRPDNRKIFPEMAQEACLKGEDLFICNLLLNPGQVICGATQKSLKWARKLEDPEDAKKPEFRSKVKARSKAKVKKQPAKAVIARRVSMTSSAGQSPHHGLQDDTWGTEGGSSYTVTKSDRFLEGHSKFPPQSQKTFVSDTGKNFTLSKAFFLCLLSGKLFHSGECAFFHL